MFYNHDSDKSSIYNKFYGDQDSFEFPNENTSLKEKEPEKNKKSPFSFDRCQIGLEEKNTEAKTYKEQKKENDAHSFFHSFTDFLNQIDKSYDSDDTLTYHELNNLNKKNIYKLYNFIISILIIFRICSPRKNC